jgi:hypothetical protein
MRCSRLETEGDGERDDDWLLENWDVLPVRRLVDELLPPLPDDWPTRRGEGGLLLLLLLL